MNFQTAEARGVDQLRDTAGRLLVRRAIDRDDWISEAIFDIAAGSKVHWTPQQWKALDHDLHACRLKLADWLDLNT